MVGFGGGRDRGTRHVARAPSSSVAPRKSSPSWSPRFLVWDRVTCLSRLTAPLEDPDARAGETGPQTQRSGSFSSPLSSAATIPAPPTDTSAFAHDRGDCVRTEPSSPPGTCLLPQICTVVLKSKAIAGGEALGGPAATARIPGLRLAACMTGGQAPSLLRVSAPSSIKRGDRGTYLMGRLGGLNGMEREEHFPKFLAHGKHFISADCHGRRCGFYCSCLNDHTVKLTFFGVLSYGFSHMYGLVRPPPKADTSKRHHPENSFVLFLHSQILPSSLLWQTGTCSPALQSRPYENVMKVEPHGVSPLETGFSRSALRPSRGTPVMAFPKSSPLSLLCSVRLSGCTIICPIPIF